MLVVFCGCETWFLTVRDEYRLEVFQYREREYKNMGKLLNEELHDLYSSPDIISAVKLRRMIRIGHVAYMGKTRNAYKNLVGISEGKLILKWVLKKQGVLGSTVSG
jgi:hypothetical protein